MLLEAHGISAAGVEPILRYVPSMAFLSSISTAAMK